MPNLSAPPTLAVIDQKLDAVSSEIRCHIQGEDTRITWTQAWRLADRLLDQRLELMGRPA